MELLLFLNSTVPCNEAVIRILAIVNLVIRIIYIAVPILIVLWGTFDLLKAVVANDDKQMNDAWKMVMKRIIYGVVIFLLGLIVHTVLSMAGAQYDRACADRAGFQTT